MNNIKRIYGRIGNYTIIKRDTEFMPYVAAYLYDPFEKSWAQGRYFHDFEDACNYALTGQTIISGRRLAEIASQALDYIEMVDDIQDFNDEYDLELTEEECNYFSVPKVEYFKRIE